jgi:hypothetical protein
MTSATRLESSLSTPSAASRYVSDLGAGPEGHMEPGQHVRARDRWQEQAFAVEEGLVTIIIGQKTPASNGFSLRPLARYEVYSREYLTFVSDYLPRAISIVAWCTESCSTIACSIANIHAIRQLQ